MSLIHLIRDRRGDMTVRYISHIDLSYWLVCRGLMPDIGNFAATIHVAKNPNNLLNCSTQNSVTHFKEADELKQESPAVADKPARRLRKVRTVYVRAVGL